MGNQAQTPKKSTEIKSPLIQDGEGNITSSPISPRDALVGGAIRTLEDINQDDEEETEALAAQIFEIFKSGSEAKERLFLKLKENPHLLKKVADLKEPQKVAWRGIYYRKDGICYLSGISGYLRPGDRLAILGAPDSQMDTLLRVIAHRDMGGETFGTLLLNGHPPNYDYKVKTSYVPKYEICLPTLTVGETIWNSYRLRLNQDYNKRAVTVRVVLALISLGLEHVKDSVVGNQVIRGISGGEKRRLTFACEVGGVTRTIFADLPTNGLDSASAFSVIDGARMVCEHFGQNMVCTLAQPSEALLNLFNNLLLMAKGHQIYFGPVSEAEGYFASLGYIRPPEVSVPDFLQELTGSGVPFYQAAYDLRAHDLEDQVEREKDWRDLASAWKKSEKHKELGLVLWNEFEEKIVAEGTKFPKSEQTYEVQMWVLIIRQWNYILRNAQMSYGRLIQGAMMGVIIGSCFFQLKLNLHDILSRFGALFYIISTFTFGCMPTIPFLVAMRSVHVFQVKSHYYRPFFFFLAYQLVELFWASIEVTFFVTGLYAMVGFQGPVLIGSHFWYTWIVGLLCHNTARVQATMLSALAPSPTSAFAMIPIVFCLHIMSNGYMVFYPNLKNFWWLLYHVNFQAWAFKGLAINENWNNGYWGKVGLEHYKIEASSESEKYTCLLYLFLVWAGWNALGAIATSNMIKEVFAETKFDDREYNKRKLEEELSSNVSMEIQSIDNEGPNLPLDIMWRNLCYDVTYKKDGEWIERRLLSDVYGCASPGKLIALMGPSGAGKTTLLDVLAGRKTGGTISGDVRINGHQKNESFFYVTGYVEQFDSHCETQTVREAIYISAKLRMPATFSETHIQDRVDSTVRKLRLQSVADDIIGDVLKGGISPEYRKKLTIACELVMDPGLLFLDEPTTGLDSASARNVMSCVKELSKTRAVVCTIHQPSSEIFSNFDTMLLLERGGTICYFGPCEKIADYFEGKGFPQYEKGVNVADYALDCSVAGQIEGKTPSEIWAESEEHLSMLVRAGESVENPGEIPTVNIKELPGIFTQFNILLKRMMLDRLRSRSDLKTRFRVMLCMSLVIGWVFWQCKNDQAGVSSRLAGLFLNVALTGFASALNVPTMIKSRNWIFRERSSKMWSVLPFVVARSLTQIPFVLVDSILLGLPAYFMRGDSNDIDRISYFLLIIIMTIMVSTAWVEVLCGLSPTQEISSALAGIFNTLFFLFCGFIIPYQSIRVYWKFMYYWSTLHYSLGALVQNEFESIGKISGFPQLYEDGKQVVSMFHADEFSSEMYIIILAGLYVAYKVLGSIIFWKINHIKR